MDSYSRDGGDTYRRRSPGIDRYSRERPRRRSRSPPAIDRYQPGGRDDKGYRQREETRRRSPNPPTHIDRYVPGQDAAPVLNNPLPNPLTLDYQVGFSWFAEWWRFDNHIKEEKERAKNGGRRLKGDKESRDEKPKEREQIQADYDAYREQMQITTAHTFVEQHKNEEWFKERYDADVRQPFREQLSEFRRGAYEKWSSDLETGIFDQFTLEGIYKGDANGDGGVAEKEEGETVAVNEVLGVADLLPTPGGELRDDAATQPTLLIKTIAPTVSRAKLEEFCREHLGDGDAGFRWLSLSDPNPTKKYHRIGWVLLNPSTERKESDPRGDGRDMDTDEIEEGAIESEGPAVSISVARTALEEINGKTIKDEQRGDFTCHVGIHEPIQTPRKKALWDLFSSPDRIERDLDLAKLLVTKLDAELGPGYDGKAMVNDRIQFLQGKGEFQPPVVTAEVKMQDEDEDEEGAIEEEPLEDEVDDEHMLITKKTLDLLVEYLRRVHSFCLFCVFESDSVHELSRKCPGGHLRRPRATLTTSAKSAAQASAQGKPFPFSKAEINAAESDPSASNGSKKFNLKPGSKSFMQLQKAFNWVKTYEEKLNQILNPEDIDLRKIGGKPVAEGLEEELKKYVKQEDEYKFRCKVDECTKLFKGESFWRKHIEKRHEEKFKAVQRDVGLVNSYVLDPAHIAPFRSDANSNGHFPMANHGQMGTPRSFNLGGAVFGGNGQLNAMQMNQILTTYGSQPQWSMGDGDRGAGPLRTGGQRYNNRTAGPYDRNGGKNGRDARWGSNNSGRLSPPRGGKPMHARFSDGGAGPREAVQGRTMKSYEDLDAASASNTTAALDY